MRAFACPRCGQLVFFENVECLRCHAGLGFDPDRRQVVQLDAGAPEVQRCANRARACCNWLLPSPDTSGPDTSGPDRSGPDTSGPDTSGPDTSGPD
ncbi:MAG: zinc-ribbon domain-containing protein, partial [Actinomycetota bacterium]|nr:zinc-ribbon domain-containing protein [Actinomycetota bacterium]